MIWKELFPTLLQTAAVKWAVLLLTSFCRCLSKQIRFHFVKVWCQCKMEILLTGKFIRINMCREGQPGTKFSWCLEGRGLLWALGDVVLLFGGGCLVGWLWLGVILVYGLAHVEVVLFFSVFAGAIFLPKNKVFYVTRSINLGSCLILCWLILSKFLWVAEFVKL